MGRRTTLSLALAGILVLSTASPVSAADPEPDVTAPVIAGTGIVEGQLAPASFTFFPDVTDDIGVTRVAIEVSGGGVGAYCAVNTSPAALRRVFCSAAMSRATDGSRPTVTLRAYDAAGNASAPSSSQVLVDNAYPKATVSPAAHSSIRTGPVTVTLAGLSADVTKAAMTNCGKEVVATRTGAPWVFRWDAAVNKAPPCIVLTDRAGNTGTLWTSYIVDEQAPVIARVDFLRVYSEHRLDQKGSWIGGAGHLDATVEDASPITHYEWRVNGVLRSAERRLFFKAWEIDTPTVTFGLRVRDAVGHTSAKSFTLNVDRTDPSMAVHPAERTLVRGKSVVSTAKAADRSGIVYLGMPGPSYPYRSVSSVTVPAGKDGPRTVTWLAIDGWGNTRWVDRTVIVDNTAPAVAYQKAPKNNAKLAKKTAFTASAADRNGIARVQLLVNGKVVATDTKAAYRFTVDPKKYGKKFTVQLRAHDKAGNARLSGKRTYRR